MSARTTGVALAFLSAVISGVSIYLNGLGVKHFADATAYTTAKNAVCALLLLLIVPLARGRSGPRRPPAPRSAALPLLVVAVVGGSVPFVLFFEGLARAQATQAAFLQKTLVIWVALLAVPFLRERVRWPQLLAIGLLLGGQAWLAGRAGHIVFGAGEAMILAATLLWAIEIVYVRWLLAGLDWRLVAVARMGLGAVLLIVWVLITGRASHLLDMTAVQWRWVLITGALLTAYVGTWYAALARAEAVTVTAVLVFGAVITAVLAGTAGPAPINAPALALVSAGCAIAAGTAARGRSAGAARWG